MARPLRTLGAFSRAQILFPEHGEKNRRPKDRYSRRVFSVEDMQPCLQRMCSGIEGAIKHASTLTAPIQEEEANCTQPIPIENLDDALTYAEQDLKDRWEWYKEKFKKGIKK